MPSSDINPIKLLDSDSDHDEGKDKKSADEMPKPSVSSLRRKRNLSKNKENTLVDVITKAFAQDAGDEQKSDVKQMRDIDIFTEHIGRELRSLQDRKKCAIMQNAIENAIFSCKMQFWQPKDDSPTFHVLPSSQSSHLPAVNPSVKRKLDVEGKGLPHTDEIFCLDIPKKHAEVPPLGESDVPKGQVVQAVVHGQPSSCQTPNIDTGSDHVIPKASSNQVKKGQKGAALMSKKKQESLPPRTTRMTLRYKSMATSDEVTVSSPGSSSEPANPDG
jgi:hypothetical protein